MKRQKKPVPTKRSLPACIYRFCTLAAMLVSVIAAAVVARANRQASVAPQAKNDSLRTCFSTLAGISRLCTIHFIGVNGWLILSLLARRLVAITSETGSKIDIERGRRAANDCFFLLLHNEVHGISRELHTSAKLMNKPAIHNRSNVENI